MSITTQVLLKDKDLEKINYFVNMGYFEDEKELIESALKKFLYELGSISNRHESSWKRFLKQGLTIHREGLSFTRIGLWIRKSRSEHF